jgi:hypothetical protein
MDKLKRFPMMLSEEVLESPHPLKATMPLWRLSFLLKFSEKE